MRVAGTNRHGDLAWLSQKCPHLGCRVPFCDASGLFECPCHVARYTRYGEYLEGPTARGMDRLFAKVEGDELVIDPETVLSGPTFGVDVIGDDAVGPFCIGD